MSSKGIGEQRAASGERELRARSPLAARRTLAAFALVLLWLAVGASLMIADVWDETNGILGFGDDARGLGEKLRFVLTESLGFWRPLPTLFVATVIHFLPGFDLSWRILRAANMLVLLGALGLWLHAIRRWGGGGRVEWLFTVAFLFSGSALITAGWYANVFDAWALLAIAGGVALLTHRRFLAGGALFGIAFFCKETAALTLPLIALLWAMGRLSFREAVRTAMPAVLLGALFVMLRMKIVPFGATGDVHGFRVDALLPTLAGTCESFWWQTMKRSGPGIAGFAFLALSLIALKRPRVIAAAALIVITSALLYWEMLVRYQDGVLLSHVHFYGRLYLIPATVLLFALAVERRTVAIALLLVPIVTGGYATYRDHIRFQRVYERIYAQAARTRPLVLRVTEVPGHATNKPLSDPIRGIEIGPSDATLVIDARSGTIRGSSSDNSFKGTR